MKTIEINLIGDLKQKAAPTKISALPQTLTEKTATPQEARNVLIVYGVGGVGLIVLVISILVWVVFLIWGFFLDSGIKDLEKKITRKTVEVAKQTKLKDNLIAYKKELFYKKKVQELIELDKFPLGQILEELRVKIPETLTLQKVVKSPKGTIIQGIVGTDSSKALDYISYFIVNLNTVKPESSLIKEAVLSTVNNKVGTVNFAIKATVVNSVQPPVNLLSNQKEEKAR